MRDLCATRTQPDFGLRIFIWTIAAIREGLNKPPSEALPLAISVRFDEF